MAKQVDVPAEARAAIEKAMNYPLPTPTEPELIGKVPVVDRNAKKTNGPLPRETYERGLAHFDQLEADRDRLERELKEAREHIRLLEIEIGEFGERRAEINKRIDACIAERDQAVREAGELRGVLNSIASICVRYHHAHQDQD